MELPGLSYIENDLGRSSICFLPLALDGKERRSYQQKP